jgi:hypothetical protein
MSITIRTRKGSFWRCGIQHTATPVTYPDGTFGASQLDALRREPMLVVDEPLAGESGNAAPALGKAPAPASEKSDAKAGKAPAAPRKTTKAK